jgi:enoyl-CoA hydratase/carnithine racemase
MMEIEDFKDILYAKEDATGIVTVTLNTPRRKNAMSQLTFLELWWAVDIMEKDDAAQVMIITGAKDPKGNDPSAEAFSSGGYFNPTALDGVPPGVMSQIDLQDIAQKRVTLKMWQCDKPIIAAINGLAIGAGITMPICCADLIYMSEYAWFRMPFVSLAIVPEFANTYILPRMIGFQRAKEIMFFGEKVSAREACEMGVANAVFSHGQLMEKAREAALKLIPPLGSALAVRMTKRALHQPLVEGLCRALDIENEGLRKAVATEDFFEALAARTQKRPPQFKGQ